VSGLSPETARKILVAAKEGGYYEHEIPDDEAELVKWGEFYYGHAIEAEKAGVYDVAVREILRLGRGKHKAEPDEWGCEEHLDVLKELHELGASARAARLFDVLWAELSKKGEEEHPFTTPWLAKRMGASDSTVERARDSLVALGAIRYRKKEGKPSLFEVVRDAGERHRLRQSIGGRQK
jgi:hypothetical protein